MELLIAQYQLYQWFVLALVALLIGMTKTGISGLGLMVVPLLAFAFDARPSTGVLLPMLIMADVYAVIHYHRSADWKHIIRLMPWAIIGILAGVLTGNYISDKGFRLVLAVMVITGIAIMVIRDFVVRSKEIPVSRTFAAILGLAGGFASMVANAAGPVFAVYLLAMRLPKNAYIGTGAWFFFIINLVKLPMHVFIWETIDLKVVLTDFLVLPLILAGAWLGVRAVRLMSERFYRILVIIMTLMSATFLLLK